MAEFRDPRRSLGEFQLRIQAAGVFVLVCFLLLGMRFVWLQLVKHRHFAAQAEGNRIALVPAIPSRGLIVDRNGVVLARNYSGYTLEITPSKLQQPLDATIDALATVVRIEPIDRKRFRKLLEESKKVESLPIRVQLTDAEVARFSAQRFRFPGVEIRARLFRDYPLGETGAHLLGYISRLSAHDQERLQQVSDDNDADERTRDPRRSIDNYRGTTHIGKGGLEQSYEYLLHGVSGFDEVEVSASGRPVRTLDRSQPTPGDNLILSVDIKLQALVEHLYGKRRGALVAIDPRNGEVLAFVSQPSFDPNLFVNGIDPENWKRLNESIDRPLYNRPLKGIYPPGSTYKPFMALAALTLGKRTPNQTIADPGYFEFGGHRFRDDNPRGHGAVNLYSSIVHSCDTYYYMLARDLGVDAIHDFMQPFGFGEKTGIDLDGELRGVLPSTAWKRAAYKRPEQQKWYDGETISLGIGQGYNSFTILQLAHATATLANHGLAFRPHLVASIEDAVSHVRRPAFAEPGAQLPLNPDHLAEVKRAMIGVNKEGTAAGAFGGADYVAAGKTGTAQVFTIGQNQKYSAAVLGERMRDHALYVAFAPAEAPRIALALVVENGGFGAQAAAPIARKVFDYLLDGKWPADVPPFSPPQLYGRGLPAAPALASSPEAAPATPPDPAQLTRRALSAARNH